MPAPLLHMGSLDQLRGFVAVGRRMSITEAARDLCLSQSAVSRQISGLEQALGTALLVRRHRAIAFTPEGERLFRVADSALQQIQDVVSTLGATREGTPVTITASIGVMALWLLPRLARFHSQFPGVEVRFSSSNQLLDMRAENVDLAIRYCKTDDVPADSVKLFGESVVPVAHPSLQVRSVTDTHVVEAQTLIEFDQGLYPWLRWESFLKAVGLGHARAKSVLRFNHYDQAVQAAVAGHGVALGRMPLVRSMIDDGRLVAVGEPVDLSPDYGYWLLQAEKNPRQDVRDLVGWIRNEAAS